MVDFLGVIYPSVIYDASRRGVGGVAHVREIRWRKPKAAKLSQGGGIR